MKKNCTFFDQMTTLPSLLLNHITPSFKDNNDNKQLEISIFKKSGTEFSIFISIVGILHKIRIQKVGDIYIYTLKDSHTGEYVGKIPKNSFDELIKSFTLRKLRPFAKILSAIYSRTLQNSSKSCLDMNLYNEIINSLLPTPLEREYASLNGAFDMVPKLTESMNKTTAYIEEILNNLNLDKRIIEDLVKNRNITDNRILRALRSLGATDEEGLSERQWNMYNRVIRENLNRNDLLKIIKRNGVRVKKKKLEKPVNFDYNMNVYRVKSTHIAQRFKQSWIEKDILIAQKMHADASCSHSLHIRWVVSKTKNRSKYILALLNNASGQIVNVVSSSRLTRSDVRNAVMLDDDTVRSVQLVIEKSAEFVEDELIHWLNGPFFLIDKLINRNIKFKLNGLWIKKRRYLLEMPPPVEVVTFFMRLALSRRKSISGAFVMIFSIFSFLLSGCNKSDPNKPDIDTDNSKTDYEQPDEDIKLTDETEYTDQDKIGEIQDENVLGDLDSIINDETPDNDEIQIDTFDKYLAKTDCIYDRVKLLDPKNLASCEGACNEYTGEETTESIVKCFMVEQYSDAQKNFKIELFGTPGKGQQLQITTWHIGECEPMLRITNLKENSENLGYSTFMTYNKQIEDKDSGEKYIVCRKTGLTEEKLNETNSTVLISYVDEENQPFTKTIENFEASKYANGIRINYIINDEEKEVRIPLSDRLRNQILNINNINAENLLQEDEFYEETVTDKSELESIINNISTIITDKANLKELARFDSLIGLTEFLANGVYKHISKVEFSIYKYP